jgi:hypothetical protein
MGDIDDLSRELTEEIEAHRVTRERMEYEKDRAQKASADYVLMQMRAEAAEARVKELEADLNAIRDTQFAWDAMMQRLTEARASKATLIADVEDWMSDALIELPHDAVELSRILDKHRGQP